MPKNSSPSENQYVSVMALGQNDPDFLKELTQLFSLAACQIIHSHQTTHGELYSLSFFVAGKWSALAKLETKLNALGEKFSFEIIVRRTHLFSPASLSEHLGSLSRPAGSSALLDTSCLLPEKILKPSFSYTLYIVSLANAEGLYQLVRFLNQNQAGIIAVDMETYLTRHTQTTMTTFTIKIQLAGDTSLSDWRERFMLFCDDMNLDAVMEPDKG